LTLGRLALGWVLAIVAFGPVAVGARALRARFLRGWSGPPAALASLMIAIGMVAGVCQILGAVGLFRRVAVAVGLALVGGVSFVLARPRRASRGASRVQGRDADAREDRPAPPAASVAGRPGVIVALVSVAVLLAEWGDRTVSALRDGMDVVDALWYHMPLAARWVQDGSITGLLYVENEPLTTFYPANSPIAHSLGIMFFGSDLLTYFITLGWMALSLLAGWCIGRPFGAAPLTLAATALALVTPAAVGTQPGAPLSDVVGMACFLAAVALVVTAVAGHRTPRVVEVAVASIGAGLAFGTKFQFILPVVALVVGAVAISSSGRRLRELAVWTGGLAAFGSFWYVRNLVATGNPLPALEVDIGPIHLPSPPLVTKISGLTDHLFRADSWREFLLPGLDRALGATWWLLLAIAVVGCGVALFGDRPQRFVGFVGLVSLVSFVFSPSAIGLLGGASFFVFTVRYLVPALGLALAGAAVAAATKGRRAVLAYVVGIAVVLVAIWLDTSDWPEFRELRLDAPVLSTRWIVSMVLGAFAVAVGAAVAKLWPGWSDRARGTFAAMSILAVVATSAVALDPYLEGRFQDTAPAPVVYRWARDVSGARIAVSGLFLQYPLYGQDLSNHVQYVGRRGPHGAFFAIGSCERWRRALNRGHYTHVVIAPVGYPFRRDLPIEAVWTATDPASVEVLADGPLRVYRLERALAPEACAGLPPDERVAAVADAAPGDASAAPGDASAAPGDASAAPGDASAAPGDASAAPGDASAAPGDGREADG